MMIFIVSWSYPEWWFIGCFGVGRRMRSILPSLATSSSFRGRSYQDLGDSTGAPGPPRGSSSTSGWLAKIDVGPERDWRGGGSHTHLAAHSVTRRKRPWNTSWLAAHSPGQCGMRCYHGSDPQRDRQGEVTTSWDGGKELRDLPPVLYARGLRRWLCLRHGGFGSFAMRWSLTLQPLTRPISPTRSVTRLALGHPRERSASVLWSPPQVRSSGLSCSARCWLFWACKYVKTLFSINASKRKAFCVFAN
jgi:hypothetical protein